MKKNLKKIKDGLKLVNQIQNIRTKNNKNWMDILRLAIKLDYYKTTALIKGIYKYDTQISALAQKIYKK